MTSVAPSKVWFDLTPIGSMGQIVITSNNGSYLTYIARDEKKGLREGKMSVSELLHFAEVHIPVSEAVREMLLNHGSKRLDSSPILNALEVTLDMDTRGKSKDAILAEVKRLAAELPKGHALRTVPACADRASAIAALTAVREAHFLTNSPTHQEKTMASKKPDTSKTATADKKGAKPATAAAPAKDEKKPAAAKPIIEAAPDKKAAAKPSAAAEKVAEKAKKKVGTPKVIVGPFEVGPKVGKAKTPEELRMHEGSARYVLMAHVLSSKKTKHTFEELQAVVGEQCAQAINLAIKKQYLVQSK